MAYCLFCNRQANSYLQNPILSLKEMYHLAPQYLHFCNGTKTFLDMKKRTKKQPRYETPYTYKVSVESENFMCSSKVHETSEEREVTIKQQGEGTAIDFSTNPSSGLWE